jgi:hypothetical protein
MQRLGFAPEDLTGAFRPSCIFGSPSIDQCGCASPAIVPQGNKLLIKLRRLNPSFKRVPRNRTMDPTLKHRAVSY